MPFNSTSFNKVLRQIWRKLWDPPADYAWGYTFLLYVHLYRIFLMYRRYEHHRDVVNIIFWNIVIVFIFDCFFLWILYNTPDLPFLLTLIVSAIVRFMY